MTDLFDLIDQGFFKKPRTDKEAKKKALLQKQQEKEAQLEAEVQALQGAIEEMTRWEPVAKVVIFYEMKCRCGEVHTVPELTITGHPLVRFRHRTHKGIWEKRLEPGSVPRNLPQVIRILPGEIHACLSCVGRGAEPLSIEDHRIPGQLSLKLSFPPEVH